jgi:hypothetical protein
MSHPFPYTVVPANICVDIRLCSSMSHPFSYTAVPANICVDIRQCSSMSHTFTYTAVPANICVDIKQCSSMPHPFTYTVCVNRQGTLIASYIDWNSSSVFPNWVRYKLYLYEGLGVG